MLGHLQVWLAGHFFIPSLNSPGFLKVVLQLLAAACSFSAPARILVWFFLLE